MVAVDLAVDTVRYTYQHTNLYPLSTNYGSAFNIPCIVHTILKVYLHTNYNAFSHRQ